MSPRKPAVLREGEHDLREYLIATAARLIAERGTAGLSVRDIARAAQVADGVLYNYFEDKDDLLVHALLAHVGAVQNGAEAMPEPGTGTVAGNLELFIDRGLAVLTQVTPVFAGLLTQPNVLNRFHAIVGGDRAFGSAGDGPGEAREQHGKGAGEPPGGREHGRGLPAILASYLRSEQELGRVDPAADVEAATQLVVGAIHGQILPPLFFSPSRKPPAMPAGLAARLATTVLTGIAPRGSRG